MTPGDALQQCQAAGSDSIQDICSTACKVVDDPSQTCVGTGAWDCEGDPVCNGVQAGTGVCSTECEAGCDNTTGWIRAWIDGEELFDYDTDRSLRCLGLAYDSGHTYGDGPPGAVVTVTNEQDGFLEADLVGFMDDHGSCEEKWGFVGLLGEGPCTGADAADVLLEKWNSSSCSPHYTCQLKLETWADQNGDCTYQGSENKEPYGGCISWDPNKTYKLRIEWE